MLIAGEGEKAVSWREAGRLGPAGGRVWTEDQKEFSQAGEEYFALSNLPQGLVSPWV